LLLYNEDCREVVKTLEDDSVQLVILDPPYGHVLKDAWDANNDVFNLDLVKQLHRVLAPTGSIYTLVWHWGKVQQSDGFPRPAEHRVHLQRLDHLEEAPWNRYA